MSRVLFNDADAPTIGQPIWDGDSRLKDRNRTDKLIEVRAAGTPTFSLQVQQSLDSQNWYEVGEAITAAGLFERSVKAPYMRVDLVSITDGSVTVVLD